ncbi:glutamate--cysteine ligase [Rhodococcus sp. USK13]|uniref:carboxylate-amine ligase n=1 Tax=Rhodococcus sp. USK13 TaxID=2806442 RepID=UPI001BD18A07|nr:glutamate--cysteine ligase [Rhodococcus sp. USK13]
MSLRPLDSARSDVPGSSRGPSVGVEEEFFLVDASTNRMLECNREVVDSARSLGGTLDLELKTSQVETNTPVCRGMRQLYEHIAGARAVAAAAATQHGAALLSTGVPPVCGEFSTVTDVPRYQRMAERYGSLVSEHEVCGCHVHVAISDRETAVQVCNYLRLWLPTLLALTANSPIHRGRDTGFASWRAVLGGRWACSWAPPYFTSADHYDSVVGVMIESGGILDEAMVYWDVRPSAHLPTVEVRVSDVPGTVDETVVVATLIRALVAAAERSVHAGRLALPVAPEVLRAAYLRAAREGVSGQLLDVTSSRLITPARQLSSLIRHVQTELDEFGERSRVEKMVKKILAQGNGATRQREAFSRRQDAADVVSVAARHMLAGSWPAAIREPDTVH